MQTPTMHTKTTTQDSQSQVDIIPEVLRAIRSKDAGSVENLLSKERIKGDYRNSAVFEAAVKSGQPELVRCLVRHGVIPLEESPIFSAIKEVSALKVVLAEGYSVNVLSSAMKPPLHVALTLNPSAIPVLLRAGCDVTSRDCLRGNTPLHSACTQCDENSILRFIQAGCALNCCNMDGETPLFCLLKHAADVRGWRDFHVRTRHSLARCLIHMGMTLTPVTSSYSSDLMTSASCTALTSSSTSQLSTSSETSLLSTSSKTSRFSPSYTASRLSTSPTTSQSSTSFCIASSEFSDISASPMTSSATPKEHSGPTKQCTTSTQSFASVSHSPPLPTSSASAAAHARPSPSRKSAERRDVMPSNDAARRKGYKVTQVYRRLLGDTRHTVWPLQHLCRVIVRERCEIHLESLQDGESGDGEGRGGEGQGEGGGRGGEEDGGGEEGEGGEEGGGEGGGGGEVGGERGGEEDGGGEGRGGEEEVGEREGRGGEKIGEREDRGRREGGVGGGGGEVEVGKEEEEVGEEEQQQEQEREEQEQEGGERQEKQTTDANVSQDIVDRGKNRTTESSLQKPVRNMMDAFGRLGVSHYLQDYLLYRHYDLDREAFSVVSKNALTM